MIVDNKLLYNTSNDEVLVIKLKNDGFVRLCIMDLGHLKEQIEKLIFINNLIFKQSEESVRALYTLQDEIKELEYVYESTKKQLEQYI